LRRTPPCAARAILPHPDSVGDNEAPAGIGGSGLDVVDEDFAAFDGRSRLAP
jgi:hypothetical protein